MTDARSTASPARSALICTALATAVATLAGCATPTPAEPQGAVRPPPALTMKGIPPVPASLPARIGRFADFKGSGVLDWSPDGKRLLVTRLAGPPEQQRTQLHTVDGPGAPLKQITFAAEPTRDAAFLPADGNVIVFERDAGGSEATRVYRLDLPAGTETPLTEAGQRCDRGAFNRAGTALLVTCARTDRTAADRRAPIEVVVELIDVRSGARRASVRLPGVGWFPSDLSADERTLIVNRYISAASTEVYRIDLASGARARLLPRDGEPAQFTLASGFSADDRHLMVTTDRFGEFRQAYRYDPATHRFDGVTADIAWDVSGGTTSRDRSQAVVIVNQGGAGVPRRVDRDTLKTAPLPLPAGLSVQGARMSPDGRRLALTAASSSSPSEVLVLDLTAPAAAPVTWVAADTAGIDTRAFTPIERIE